MPAALMHWPFISKVAGAPVTLLFDAREKAIAQS
jgi:hypothetical protein